MDAHISVLNGAKKGVLGSHNVPKDWRCRPDLLSRFTQGHRPRCTCKVCSAVRTQLEHVTGAQQP